MRLGIVRLYLGESGKIGYYNSQELGLAKSLEKLGVYSTVFFLVDKRYEKELSAKKISEKITIVYVPAYKLFNHGICSPKFLKNYDLDIVHLLSDNQIMVPKFNRFCNKNKICIYNYVGAIESDSENIYKKKLIDIISKKNIREYKKSNIIAKTVYVKDKLISLGVYKCEVINVGLDLEVIKKIDANKHELRKKLGIEADRKIILFVGRLEEYKNPFKSIELLKNLIRKDKKYFMIIIGDGNLKNKFIKCLELNGLKQYVMYIEKIENKFIHEYYKLSDFFINFNKNEIFGMSILEAMNQECKVIAINAPGPNEIIKHNLNGFLMKDFDMEKWSQIIEKNIENIYIGKEAKKSVIKNFDWDNIAKKYLKIINARGI